MNNPGPNHWGVRSLITGNVYPLAKTQRAAEFLWVNTGAPERYEVVECSGDEWVARPGDTTLVPVPELVVGTREAPVWEDEEMVRLAIRLADPMYGVKVPLLTVTGAEIRAIAERRWSYRVRKRLNRLRLLGL